MAKTFFLYLTIFVFVNLVSSGKFFNKIVQKYNFYQFNIETTYYYCKQDFTIAYFVENTSNYSVLSLFPAKKEFFLTHCNWRITTATSGSYLNLINVNLLSNDNLTIGCNGFSEIFFHTNGGFFQQKLVSLAKCSYVIVALYFTENVIDKNASNQRTFLAHYYPSVIPLQQNTGQLTFPKLKKVISIPTGRMVFQPGQLFGGHLVLLNFTQLPVDDLLDVVVDGVQLTSTLPTMFLQSPLKSNITVTLKLRYSKSITVRYWLVSAKCSGKAVLSADQGMRPIFNNLNDQIENQRESAEFVRCATHFSTAEIEDSQFAVQLHNLTGLADLADSMYFYNNRGQVVLGQNNLAGVYSASGNEKTLINLNNVLVMYESPYVVLPIADFQTPQIEVVSKTG